MYNRSSGSAVHSRPKVFFHFTFFWIAGVLSGFVLAHRFSSELMQIDLLYGSISHLGLFLSAIVPVVLCALFAIYRMDFCAYVVCFVKAFLFGFFLLSFASCVPAPYYCLTGTFFLQCCCCSLMLLSYFYLRNLPPKKSFVFVSSVVVICLILVLMIELFPDFI